jgi:pSer/pThr/pTyr-binding forkhead associated (FHA) protein/ferredoxin
MWDAMRAVEAIARAAGKVVVVEARSVAPRSKPAAPALQKPSPPSTPDTSLRTEEPLQAWLVSLRGDGSEAERLALHKDTITIGRSGTDVVCAEDVHMEPLHVRLVRRADRYFLEDPGTNSGVWSRIGSVQPRVLSDGDFLWVGSQILKVVRQDGVWAVEHYKGGNLQDTLGIGEQGLFVGRGAGETRAPEAVLDEADTFLSRRHAQLRIQDGRLTVLDMKSKNGTFERLAAPLRLEAGDEFHAGNTKFRFDLAASIEPFAAEPAAPVTPTAAGAPAGAAAVVIEHPQHPVSFPVATGQTVLDAFIAYLREVHADEKPEKYRKKPLNWECKGGTCGLCAVQILEGAAHLDGTGADAEELNTLEVRAFVEPDPNQFRLACKATIDGPVKLGIPE